MEGNLEDGGLKMVNVVQCLKKPTDLLKLIVNKDNVIPCSVGFWLHKLQIHITDCNWNLAPKMHERDSIVSASLENSL